MRNRKVRSGLVAVALFASGWCAAELTSDNLGAMAQQPAQPALDQTVQALMFGIATVAIDAEAAAMRIAEMGDRYAALERRVAALEGQAKR